jgi:hypothetical protein
MFQIMNTSLNQWQTTRFSVFTRPSRVEVNTQKDLEDMLSKLDETPVRPGMGMLFDTKINE